MSWSGWKRTSNPRLVDAVHRLGSAGVGGVGVDAGVRSEEPGGDIGDRYPGGLVELPVDEDDRWVGKDLVLGGENPLVGVELGAEGLYDLGDGSLIGGGEAFRSPERPTDDVVGTETHEGEDGVGIEDGVGGARAPRPGFRADGREARTPTCRAGSPSPGRTSTLWIPLSVEIPVSAGKSGSAGSMDTSHAPAATTSDERPVGLGLGPEHTAVHPAGEMPTRPARCRRTARAGW